jgi:hypothetical protein
LEQLTCQLENIWDVKTYMSKYIIEKINHLLPSGADRLIQNTGRFVENSEFNLIF